MKNIGFLESIPKRKNNLRSDLAVEYSRGACIIYAKALEAVRNQKTCIIKEKNDPNKFHAFLCLNDYEVEDSWGIQSIDRIIQRYGFINPEFDFHLLDILFNKAISTDKAKALMKLDLAIKCINDSEE